MMRLKKGSKVEVLGGKGLPSGSWIPAEIIAGNGHTYSIRYDREQPDVGGAIVSSVPRKLVRPPPPLGQSSGDWKPGDVVEMLDEGLWKPGEVSELAGEGYFLVRLVGCSEMFQVHHSNLRTRRVWQNNQWRVMEKESPHETEGDLNRQGHDFEQIVMEDKPHHPRKGKLHVTSPYSVKNVSAIGRLPTRRSYRVNKKRGAAQDDHVQWKLPEYNFLGLPEKVVAISSKKNNLGGKSIFPSHPNRSRPCAMESGKGMPNAAFPWTSLGHDKAQCDELSACSSTGSNSMNLLCPYSLADCHPGIDEQSDDAYSFTGTTTKKQSMKLACEDISAEIHKLELHAYRSTLEALYASGPMSWEQESLISSLRLELHISDDEHLLELRSLTSRESNIIRH